MKRRPVCAPALATSSCWRWQYYFVFLTGRNKRALSARERQVQRLSMAIVLSVFLLVSAAVGILVLYFVKSALGIDLIPGYSFGVWGWFQENVLKAL